MSAEVETKVVPREITDAEVAFFREHGWVHLEQLISEADAARLLGELQGLMGPDAATMRHPDPGPAQERWFSVYAPVAIENATAEVHNQAFFSFSHSPELGSAGARLHGTPMRYWTDVSLVKTPSGSQRGGATPWHIDIATVETCPFSVQGQMQFWIALCPVSAENGTMRFVSPQDITDEVRAICDANEVDASYPLLEELGVLSRPLNLRAGDATVHGSQTLHSAPPNAMDIARWIYTVSLFPADALYSGIPWWPIAGVDGVEVGKAFPDHRFPVLA